MPVKEVAGVVDQVLGWIAASFARSVWVDRPLERVRENLASGAYRLLLGAIDDKVMGAAVLEETELDGRPVMFVVSAGGVGNETFSTVAPAMWRGVCDLARARGRSSVVTVGRPGWYRWVKAQGARVTMRQVLCEAELSVVEG